MGGAGEGGCEGAIKTVGHRINLICVAHKKGKQREVNNKMLRIRSVHSVRAKTSYKRRFDHLDVFYG